MQSLLAFLFERMVLMLFASMLVLGALIGFVGAGGAGVTIALLTVGFHPRAHPYGARRGTRLDGLHDAVRHDQPLPPA